MLLPDHTRNGGHEAYIVCFTTYVLVKEGQADAASLDIDLDAILAEVVAFFSGIIFAK